MGEYVQDCWCPPLPVGGSQQPTASQRTKSHAGEPATPKDVKNEGRSGNVYENKGSDDQLSESFSGICARSKLILQKILNFDGQIFTFLRFRNRFLVEFLRPVNICSWLARVALSPEREFW